MYVILKLHKAGIHAMNDMLLSVRAKLLHKKTPLSMEPPLEEVEVRDELFQSKACNVDGFTGHLELDRAR